MTGRCILALGTALLIVSDAGAKIGAIDNVPAATLLLPHFEVDTTAASGQGYTTVFWVRNASASPVVAHVTLWTDYAVPTIAFDVDLAAFASQEINLHDVFDGATVAGTDFSAEAERLLQAHTGQPLAGDLQQCAGRDFGDSYARGYVLVDNALGGETRPDFPTDPAYFDDPNDAEDTYRALNGNVLWGNYYYQDAVNNFAQGEPMVHIEASDTDPLVTTPGNFTFYASYVGGTARDRREPLATKWSSPFSTAGPGSGALLIYWRDVRAMGAPVSCYMGPDWFPLSHAGVVVWDDAANSQQPTMAWDALGLACGRIDVGRSYGIPVFSEQGWVFLNLNLDLNVPPFGTRSQSFVTTLLYSEGRYSSGAVSTPLESAAGP